MEALPLTLPHRSVDLSEVLSEADCNRAETVHLDEALLLHAGVPPGAPRGGWECTITLFVLEDDFAQNEEVEAEVGFISYNIGDDDICEVVDLEVAEGLRGRGFGSRLLEEALADMRLKGGTRVYLSAYEATEGDRSGFFGRFGFAPVEVPDSQWRAEMLPFPMWLGLEGG
jgi:ribosomal protein S18 acetylase RimI-like enzyme